MTAVDELQALMATNPAAAGEAALRALASAREADEPATVGQFAYLAAQARSREGRNTEALGLIAEAQRAYVRSGNDLAGLRIQLGRINVLNELGRHGEALSVAQALRAGLDGRALPEALDWLPAAAAKNEGVVLGLLGRHAEALAAYEAAHMSFRALGIAEEDGPLLHNQALELLALGRAEEALARFRRAARRFAAVRDRVAATESRRDAATALLHVGRFEAALRMLQRAKRTFASLEMEGEVARTGLSVGEAYLALGRLPEAEASLREAADALELIGLPHDHAVALLALGRTLLRLRQRREADVVLQTAADRADSCQDVPLWAMATLERGLAAAERDGEPGSGAEVVGRALAALQAGEWPVQELATHLEGLRLALARGDVDAARSHLEQAQRCGRLAPRADLKRRTLHARGRVAMATGQLGDAVASLSSAVLSMQADSLDLSDPVARLRFLQEGADAAADLVVAQIRRGEPEAAARALAIRKAWVLHTQLRANVGGGDVLDLVPREMAAQQAAPAGATVVSWQAHAGHLHALVHREDGVSAHDLGALAPVEAVVEQLEAQWVRLRGGGPVVERFAERLAATADHLLGVLRDRLIAPLELTGERPLVLVPDGPLHHVPFAALGGRERPLVVDHDLTVAPSASLAHHHLVGLPVDDGVLLMAPTPEDLPATRREVDTIAAVLGRSPVLYGEQATAEALRAGLADARLVHLACHGRFRADAPFASEIRLADRWVPASSMAEWDWRDRIVVLSACAVGRSAALGGERAGMARALLGAGASAVLVAKWDVPDTATSTLLTDTYAALQGHTPLAAALRSAQTAAAATGAHPVSWAAFEVMHR